MFFLEQPVLKGFSPTHTSKLGNLPDRESYIKSIFERIQEHNSISLRLEKREMHELMMAQIIEYSKIGSLNDAMN